MIYFKSAHEWSCILFDHQARSIGEKSQLKAKACFENINYISAIDSQNILKEKCLRWHSELFESRRQQQDSKK